MRIRSILGLVGGVLLAASGAPLLGQTYYSQIGNEATAPTAIATTPLYRSGSTST
jgi:hypothetical protein